MARDWACEADRWLGEFGWNELARDGFTQVDIDWFSGEPPSRPVPAALDWVHAALEVAQKRHHGIDGLVTVPLPESDHMDTELPDLAGLLESDWKYGPGRQVVGLYILDPALLAPVDGVDDFRASYDVSELLPPPLTAYYRCWSLIGAGWDEYARTVYIRTNTVS